MDKTKFDIYGIIDQDKWLTDYVSDLTLEEVMTTLWGMYERPDDYDKTFEEAVDIAADILGMNPLHIIGEMFFS